METDTIKKIFPFAKMKLTNNNGFNGSILAHLCNYFNYVN